MVSARRPFLLVGKLVYLLCPIKNNDEQLISLTEIPVAFFQEPDQTKIEIYYWTGATKTSLSATDSVQKHLHVFKLD